MPAKEMYKKYLRKEGLKYSERVDITAFDRSHNHWDSIDMRINAATELKILEGIDTSDHLETLEALQISDSNTQDFLEKEYYQIMKYEKASPINHKPIEKPMEQVFSEKQMNYIQSKVNLAESSLKVDRAHFDMLFERKDQAELAENFDSEKEIEIETYIPQDLEELEKLENAVENEFRTQMEMTKNIEKTLSKEEAQEVNDLFPSSVESNEFTYPRLTKHVHAAKEILERNQPKGAEVTIERSANKVGAVSKAVTFERDR